MRIDEKPLKRNYADFTAAAAGLQSFRAIVLLVIALPLALLLMFVLGSILGFLGTLFAGEASASGTGIAVAGISVWMTLFPLFLLPVFFGPFLLIAASPAGMVLMDVARGFPERSIGDALLTGLPAGLKVLGSLLLAFLLVLLWLVVVALALYVCKLPYIGPLLFAVLVPAATVGTGIVLAGFLFAFVLLPPAIWEGLGVVQATSQFYEIIRTRILEAFIQVPVLYGKILLLMGGLALVLLVGNTVVGFIAEGVLHIRLGVIQQAACSISGIFGTRSESFCEPESAATSLLVAKNVGSGFLWIISYCAIGAIVLMAVNLLYLDLSDGLGSTSPIIPDEQIETAKVVAGEVRVGFTRALHAAQVVAGEAGSRLKQRMHEAEERAQTRARQRGSSSPVVGGSVCPQCASRVSESDAFCGSCGARLEGSKLVEQGES